jgi:hypothetical protein
MTGKIQALVADAVTYMRSTKGRRRPVADKFAEFVSITDYPGVVGDGATNCTDGIQAAIGENLQIDVPEGTFVCGKTATSGDFLLYLGTNNGQPSRQGLTIKGRGRKSVIKLADNAGANTLLFGAGGADIIKELTIRDLTIDLNGVANLQNTYGDALRYNAAIYLYCLCGDIVIDNVWVLNGSGHQPVRIGNDTAAGYAKNVRISNCRFKNFGMGVPGNMSQDTSAVYVQADNIMMLNNVVECDQFTFDASKGHTGFELHGDKSTIISGNTFTNIQMPWLMASSQKSSQNIKISGNTYLECFYHGSLDPSNYDQKVIDIGPGEVFTSSKSQAVILQIGNSTENAKVRDKIRYIGNHVTTWGNLNNGTHLVDLTNRYIRALDIVGNTFAGLNGSLIFYTGNVRDAACAIRVENNDIDSIGATAASYAGAPDRPSVLHIDVLTGAGTNPINSLSFRNNTVRNTAGKDYTLYGLVKLGGAINYLYVKDNTNTLSSAYKLTTGTPTVQFKDVDRNYPAVWQADCYESAFNQVAANGFLDLYDFTGWLDNDFADYRLTVYVTTGTASNLNTVGRYEVMVCGASRLAAAVGLTGTYAGNLSVQFVGTKLRIVSTVGTVLYAKVVVSGNSSKPVSFLV